MSLERNDEDGRDSRVEQRTALCFENLGGYRACVSGVWAPAVFSIAFACLTVVELYDFI